MFWGFFCQRTDTKNKKRMKKVVKNIGLIFTEYYVFNMHPAPETYICAGKTAESETSVLELRTNYSPHCGLTAAVPDRGRSESVRDLYKPGLHVATSYQSRC